MLGGLPPHDAESLSEFAGDLLAEFIASASGSEKVKQLVPLIKLMRQMKSLFDDFGYGELGGTVAGAVMKITGYYLQIEGQMLLTDAEFLDPGFGSWWGWGDYAGV